MLVFYCQQLLLIFIVDAIINKLIGSMYQALKHFSSSYITKLGLHDCLELILIQKLELF